MTIDKKHQLICVLLFCGLIAIAALACLIAILTRPRPQVIKDIQLNDTIRRYISKIMEQRPFVCEPLSHVVPLPLIRGEKRLRPHQAQVLKRCFSGDDDNNNTICPREKKCLPTRKRTKSIDVDALNDNGSFVPVSIDVYDHTLCSCQ